jgi:flagellar hook-length control protein FliK
MLPVTFGFDPATSLNAPCPAPKGGGATPAATGPGSFHTMLRDVAAAKAAAPAKTAPPHREDAVNETDRGAAADKSHARPTRRQNLTAGADTNAVAVETPANAAPAHRKDAVNETGCGAAADDSHTQPTRRSAANDTAGQPVWALLAQIIQNLNAAADTNAVVVEGEGAAVASGPAAGDAAKDLAALVDLLKQLQESPAALTAESAIPLDRLRQMLEQWQAGANESQPTGLPGRLLDLLKNVQDGLPGIAWDRWAAALESQDGAAAKVAFETASPSGAGLISAAGSQHDGQPIGAGRAARGVLLDAKATPVVAGKADAAVGADELSDQDRPAADERGPGAGRVMPALPPAASPPAETLRSTAVSPKVQASEGSFTLPRNFEAAPDTQSEVSDDSRSPADKATTGLALSKADHVVEEGASPSLRFDAALRDVRGFAVPEGSPDKPAEAAAAVKGRDTAAAPVKADVFDQIVQRAAVHVKNDQGEMRIDLKPEFLGHVRLQIVTENQQITVRILTELPMVRDMIENNIQQLKSDLQQQGLRVERVEVAVADDPREHPGRQAWTGSGRKGHADGDVAPAAAEISAGLRPEAAYRWGLGGQTTINMFA